MLPEKWIDNGSLELFKDAAGSIGFGAYFQGHWSQGTWPTHWQQASPDIMFKELFPIVLAVHLWADQLQNKRLVLNCDNQAVVNIINKQSTRSPLSMQLLRLLVLACLQNNLVCKARHLPGVQNNIADALSRGQMQRFRILAPSADTHPTVIPDPLQRLLKLK